MPTWDYPLWLARPSTGLFLLLKTEYGRKFKVGRENYCLEQGRKSLSKQWRNTIGVFQLPVKLCDELNAMCARFW